MIGFVFINEEKIGQSNFKVIDEGMGAIGGDMVPYETYSRYKRKIQELYEEKGIANMADFNFRIILDDGSVLQPQGGVGITDSVEFKEIYVEAAGLPRDIIKKVKAALL